MLLQDELALKYKYKKLSLELSEESRKIYLETLPVNLNINGDKSFKLYSKENTLISDGYNRIVIGDYGAFIEFDSTQIIKSNIKVKKGEEYRIHDDKYNKSVKYFWFTTKDNSDIKIYYQQKTVPYADYQPNMFYVSPFDIC